MDVRACARPPGRRGRRPLRGARGGAIHDDEHDPSHSDDDVASAPRVRRDARVDRLRRRLPVRHAHRARRLVVARRWLGGSGGDPPPGDGARSATGRAGAELRRSRRVGGRPAPHRVVAVADDGAAALRRGVVRSARHGSIAPDRLRRRWRARPQRGHRARAHHRRGARRAAPVQRAVRRRVPAAQRRVRGAGGDPQRRPRPRSAAHRPRRAGARLRRLLLRQHPGCGVRADVPDARGPDGARRPSRLLAQLPRLRVRTGPRVHGGAERLPRLVRAVPLLAGRDG